MKVKVFCGTMMGSLSDKVHGQLRVVMACTSKKKFLQATGLSKNYVSETFNERDVEAAMSAPGVLFGCGLDDYHGPYFVMSA